MLRDMIAKDEERRNAGWQRFEGAVNHQGDYYDSTVAVIPFLIEVITSANTPDRADILNYLRTRWLDAPAYGGDPSMTEPPGGVEGRSSELFGRGEGGLLRPAIGSQGRGWRLLGRLRSWLLS